MTEAIRCPLCETSSSKPVIEDNGFTGRQCDECGLIFVSPRPSAQEMAELYAEGDAYLPPEFFLGTSDSLPGRVAARHAAKILGRHIAGGSVLEIGPGNGQFLAAARSQGFAVYGVELNPVQADFIRERRGIPCVTALELTPELGRRQFDVIYHRDVVSHFYDPITEFGRINALLSSGGLHVFETGNFGDVDHRHFAHVRSFQYPDHLFFYSERSVADLLRRTGFELVHIYRYSTWPERVLRSQVWRLSGRGRNGSGDQLGAPVPADGSPISPPSRAGRAARDALDLTYYGLRRTVGAVAIRRDDPQTLTIVARKVRDSAPGVS